MSNASVYDELCAAIATGAILPNERLIETELMERFDADPDDFIQAAMAWHFDPDTGSPFWIERARTLEFDPLTDVKTHADLALFPNVTGELRDVPVTKLIPRGYGPRPDVISVIESGGTTGAPKALPLMADFARLMVARDVWILEHYGLTREKNWLCFSPGGPHGAFEQAKRGARAWGYFRSASTWTRAG